MSCASFMESALVVGDCGFFGCSSFSLLLPLPLSGLGTAFVILGFFCGPLVAGVGDLGLLGALRFFDAAADLDAPPFFGVFSGEVSLGPDLVAPERVVGAMSAVPCGKLCLRWARKQTHA